MAKPEIRGQETTFFGEAAKKFSEHRRGEFSLGISSALEKSRDAWGEQDPEEILGGSEEVRRVAREKLGDLTPFLQSIWFVQEGEATPNIPQHIRESDVAVVEVGDGKWRDALTSELDNPTRKKNLVINAAVESAAKRESLGWIEMEIKEMEGKRPTKENIEKLGKLHVEAAEKEKMIATADAAVKNHEGELDEKDREQMKRAVLTALSGMGSARIRTFTPRPSIFDGGSYV
ncbi:MAG: hypothetical protein Q7S52_06095 [bacterium]|nr:hypothetical protein [bacterium]